MKITDIHYYHVPPRWCFVKVETDLGICGWGEAVVEGRAQTVAAAIDEIKPALLGKNPHRIQALWQLMYRGSFYRGGAILMSALSGIDQALWDIKGKHLQAPVYELLGGACRDKIKAYCWVGGDSPQDLVAGIRQIKAAGFDTVKFNACGALPLLATQKECDAVIERVAEVRHAFADSVNFGIDFHGRVSLTNARILLAALANYQPLFVEEPVLPEYADRYATLAAQTTIPLAAGERAYSRFDVKSILAAGGLSIIQPDLAHAGGISECHKIAAMAEAYDVAFAPHCPLGPLALASCLQVDAVAHNAVLQEHSMGIHYNKDYDLTDYIVDKSVFAIEDGYFHLPTLPGLGVEIDESVVQERSQAYAGDWHNPVWSYPDGSIAEW